MISNGLVNWQQLKRLRIEGDVVYGVYQSVGFSVAEEDGGKLFIFMLSGSDAAYDALEDSLAAQRGPLREIQVGDVEYYLALFFDEAAGPMTGAIMDGLLDFVAANARPLGFRVPTVCVKCGAPAQKRAFYKNMVQPMCASCREAEKNAASSKPAAPYAQSYAYGQSPAQDPWSSAPSKKEPEYPSYDAPESIYAPDPSIQRQRPVLSEEPVKTDNGPREPGTLTKGLLGALLGTVAGLIPYFISVIIGFELGALCFLAGIGAAFGYTAFGGLRQKSTALGVVIAFAEVFSLVSIVVVKAINGGLGAMFADTMDYINVAMAVLGALLGVSVSIDRINKHVA